MKILNAVAQGFRSIAQPQDFDFQNLSPGLYHITGANGAGKSSFFEAVFWACYGKTSRGLRAGSIHSWDSYGFKDPTAVVLNVQTTAGDFELLRTWGPNNLEVTQAGETRPVDQAELDRMLGMSAASFLYSIYFAQSAAAFVDLDAAKQTQVFSDVLGLDVWDAAAKKASERAASLAADMQRMELDYATAQGQADELLLTDYSKQEKEWATNRAQRAKAAASALTIAKAAVTRCAADVKATRGMSEKFDAAYGEKVNEEARWGNLLAKVDELDAALRTLERDDYDKCPTCGSAVSNEHIQTEIAKAKARLRAARADAAKAEKVYKEAERKANGLRHHHQLSKDANQAYTQAESELRWITAELRNIQAEESPYARMQAELEKRGQQLADKLDVLAEALGETDRHVKATAYWIKGFKEIRLSQIEASLAQLTLECNEVLFQLGLQDWEIQFAGEKETKSGTVTKTFTTTIKAPGAPAAVPWEAWSGGEGQRLRLAISMGFANLIGNRTGTAPNVEFWDEPTAGLTSEGILDLIAVLDERARRYSRVIMLADHRAFEYGGFAGVIAVSKTKDGTVFKMK